MKKRFFVFLMGILGIMSFTVLHPYHVGSVDIAYNTQSKTFEIVGTFFMDDLEDDINKGRSSKVFFKHEKHEKKMNEAIASWGKRNFGLVVNGKALPIRCLGYEEDKESVHVYLESDMVSAPKVVEVGVSALYTLFDDQLNIVHVTVNGKRKSHKLRYPKKYLKQTF